MNAEDKQIRGGGRMDGVYQQHIYDDALASRINQGVLGEGRVVKCRVRDGLREDSGNWPCALSSFISCLTSGVVE